MRANIIKNLQSTTTTTVIGEITNSFSISVEKNISFYISPINMLHNKCILCKQHMGKNHENSSLHKSLVKHYKDHMGEGSLPCFKTERNCHKTLSKKKKTKINRGEIYEDQRLVRGTQEVRDPKKSLVGFVKPKSKEITSEGKATFIVILADFKTRELVFSEITFSNDTGRWHSDKMDNQNLLTTLSNFDSYKEISRL